MFTLKSKLLGLSMKEDGTEIVIEDLTRGVRWCLDESTRLAAHGILRFDHKAYSSEAILGKDSKVCVLGSGKARRIGENTIISTHITSSGKVSLRWVIQDDRLQVFAYADENDGASALSLPGTFRPVNERSFLSAIPNAQGILYTGEGPSLYRPLCDKGHGPGFTLGMFGQISSRSGLVIISETNADAVLHWEKTDQGQVNLMWLQHPSMGKLSYTRETVIMPSSPDLTSICKTYRRYVIEKNRFKSWEEKVSERPILEKLFGAAIVFLGYHQDPTLDYASSFRKLKNMGVDKAFVYPVYTWSWDPTRAIDLKDGTDISFIDIREYLPLVGELGYATGSFITVTCGLMGEGEDRYRDLILDHRGEPIIEWRIENLVWYILSADKRSERAHKLLDDEHGGLNGIHYDVICVGGLREDYNPVHLRDARTDVKSREEMLKYAGEKGLIVSSEGFWDDMTPYYDLGNSKYAHVLGDSEYCVVPMTMLVYHDSAYHTWWEVDNYNNPEHRTQFGRGYHKRFGWGGGFPQLQSAIDALMGTPPDIFPFGIQYNFIPRNVPKIYTYRYRIEDASVREAIECAKPVMALNKQVGKLEMVEHKLHTSDGAIQETIFADGTRVIANFANIALEAPRVGLMSPESWEVI